MDGGDASAHGKGDFGIFSLKAHVEFGGGALQHAVARDVGADDLREAGGPEAVHEVVDAQGRVLQPAVYAHQSVAHVGAEHHAFRAVVEQPAFEEGGLLSRHAAHYGIACAGLEDGLQCLVALDAAAPFNFGSRHSGQGAQHVEVGGMGSLGSVEVDHVHAVEAMRHVLAYHVEGRGVVGAAPGVVALGEAHAAATDEVDGGDDEGGRGLHGEGGGKRLGWKCGDGRRRTEAASEREEVVQDALAHVAALFGVELRAVEVFILQCCAEERAVVRGGDGVGAERGVVGMHVVDEFASLQPREEFALEVAYLVPAHVRHFEVGCRLEAAHVAVENAEALGVALLRVAAHYLQPYADAQHRLAQRGYDGIEPRGAEVAHGLAAVAHAGQQHAVGAANDGGVGRDHEVGAKAVQGIFHRTQVAHFVVDNGNHGMLLRVRLEGAWCISNPPSVRSIIYKE